MKQIEDFVGYWVDNGFILSDWGKGSQGCDPKYRHVLNSKDNGKGYYQVFLYKDGKRHPKRVHQLVAQAFIPNPCGYKEVNHINEDKSDNRIENLEWCDRKYNCNFGTSKERSAAKHRGVKQSPETVAKKSKIVCRYSTSGELLDEWCSISSASRALGICVSSIIACCKGDLESTNGYVWKYKE